MGRHRGITVMTDNDLISNIHRRKDDERLTLIEHKLDKLSNDVEDLVAAWKAANFVVGFIKWVGGLSTALGAIYTLIKLKG